MMNKMIVNQIWIGAELPERERAWVAGVRAGAEGAGWEHRLWDWEALSAAYGHEPVYKVFSRAMEALPMPTVYAFVVDYYQYRVLADVGGMYLDTDMELRGAWPWAAVEGADVMLLGEFFKPTAACCGAFLAAGEGGARAMRMAAAAAERHILKQISADAQDFETKLVRMVREGGNLTHGCGPGWLRAVALPLWEAAGVRLSFFDNKDVGHIQWRRRGVESAITHIGQAHWHYDRRGAMGAWDKIAAAAAEHDARHNSIRAHARARGQAEAMPGAAAAGKGLGAKLILPKRRLVKKGASAEAEAKAEERDCPIPLPQGVRRIIIFSNIRRGVSVENAGVREGDLCMHLNRAVHAAEAKAVPGTMHMLFVRPRASRHDEWFVPDVVNYYERVYFIREPSELPGMKWLTEWRARSKCSPTTGFLIANMCRELWPHVPLILNGFEPDVQHDSGRWQGHDWHGEAAWYREKAFRQLRPGERVNPRILLLLNSCWQADPCRWAREKNGRNGADKAARRQACRETWLANLPPHITYRFVLGAPPQGAAHEDDVLATPFADGLQSLCSRAAFALRWACERDDWDWLVRSDDDDYIDLPRLVQWLELQDPRRIAVYGTRCLASGLGELLGGCGMVLSRATAEAVARDACYPGALIEDDLDLCRAVLRAGGRVIHPPELQAVPRAGKLDSEALCAYWLTPSAMRGLHRAQSVGWIMPNFTGGRLGNCLFELAAAFAHAQRHGLQLIVPWRCYRTPWELRNMLGHPPIPEAIRSSALVFRHLQFHYEPIPATERNGALRGYFQSARYFDDCEPALRELYAPLTARREPGTLGIHIRLGDYRKRPDFFVTMSPEWLRRALALTSCRRVVLFYSDDAEEARGILHAALEGMSGYSIEEQHVSAADDLRRMSAMEELIISASTFAWWGAWLGQQARVIAPDKWLKDPTKNTQDIYLQSWTRL